MAKSGSTKNTQHPRPAKTGSGGKPPPPPKKGKGGTKNKPLPPGDGKPWGT